MDVWLVVNPKAGAGRAARVAASAVPLLRDAGIEPTVHICASGDEPAQAAVMARERGADVVVAVGGDGLVAGVAEGLLAGEGSPGAHGCNGTALAVMATGSANDYARALGVRDLGLAAQVALITQPAARVRVDVVGVDIDGSRRHILNVGGTGFDALVAERATRITRLRGAPRYVSAMLVELPRFRGANFRLDIDGRPFEMRAMMIALANGTTYGGGMRIAPSAHLQNGWLDICVVGQLSRLEFLRAFPLVFRGTHVNHPAVTMLRAHQVKVESDLQFGVLGDGELLGSLPATFSLLPAALSVVVAPGAKLA